MRAGFGMAHQVSDSILEFLADVVFEALRLLVNFVLLEAEMLHEVPLDEPVMPDHFQRHFLALQSQARAVIGRVIDPATLGEEAKHLADSGQTVAKARGQLLGVGRPIFLRENVDRLDVILDCFCHMDI